MRTCQYLQSPDEKERKKVSVLLSASVKRFGVSRMQDFFGSCAVIPRVLSCVVIRRLPPLAKGLLYSHRDGYPTVQNPHSTQPLQRRL